MLSDCDLAITKYFLSLIYKGIFQSKIVSIFFLVNFRIQCSRIQCVWDPQCKYLFIPGRGGIIVVDCLTWDRETLLTYPDVAYVCLFYTHYFKL